MAHDERCPGSDESKRSFAMYIKPNPVVVSFNMCIKFSQSVLRVESIGEVIKSCPKE